MAPRSWTRPRPEQYLACHALYRLASNLDRQVANAFGDTWRGAEQLRERTGPDWR